MVEWSGRDKWRMHKKARLLNCLIGNPRFIQLSDISFYNLATLFQAVCILFKLAWIDEADSTWLGALAPLSRALF